ncbi:MAG: ASKHA domain-containing protein [Lachnospiraceae bacterium]|nr:ASKHA domain-containing protein [Lachnospiraceae bacterium]MEE3460538.1 ASKHA domain-containing protein [Lachnospiraceae bacterium]
MVIVRSLENNVNKAQLPDFTEYAGKMSVEKDSLSDTASGDKGNIAEEDDAFMLGAAVDIGTTNIALALFDLKTGKCLGKRSAVNRQTIMGKDVMMRIMNARNGMASSLHNMVISQVTEMLDSCLAEQGAYNTELLKASFTGNTVMCHFLLDKDVSGLAGAPFTRSYEGSFSCKGIDIGFDEFRDMEVYVMPGIMSHVGADALSVFCEEHMSDSHEKSLAIDIGTNAEILLYDGENSFAASVAAGPAFEGAGMECGMRAEAGAVTHVTIAPVAKTIYIDVIPQPFSGGFKGPGSKAPKVRGIAAAGYVDLIYELVKNGIVSEDGFMTGPDDIHEDMGIPGFLTESLETKNGHSQFDLYLQNPACLNSDKDYNKNIVLTQDDIRAFQLAKAAICSGITAVLKKAGMTPADLERIYLAGMFGNALNIDHAISVGLLPKDITCPVDLVGNAALRGCARTLFDEGFMKYCCEKAGSIRHIELADDPEFKEMYIDAFGLA